MGSDYNSGTVFLPGAVGATGTVLGSYYTFSGGNCIKSGYAYYDGSVHTLGNNVASLNAVNRYGEILGLDTAGNLLTFDSTGTNLPSQWHGALLSWNKSHHILGDIQLWEDGIDYGVNDIVPEASG